MKHPVFLRFLTLALLAAGAASFAWAADDKNDENTNDANDDAQNQSVPTQTVPVQIVPINVGRYQLMDDGLGGYLKIDTTTGETWHYALGHWDKIGQ